MRQFFGDDWTDGVKVLHEIEKMNYVFATKSENWLQVRRCYDVVDEQTVPFLCPPQRITKEDLARAELHWSAWLAVQDWIFDWA